MQESLRYVIINHFVCLSFVVLFFDKRHAVCTILISFALLTHIGWQIICPFILDQFYWAERMFWLGVSPEPLKRNHLVPDDLNDSTIKEAAKSLSDAINYALSSEVKARAIEISKRITLEVSSIKYPCCLWFITIAFASSHASYCSFFSTNCLFAWYICW